jgi:hypothetical protein
MPWLMVTSTDWPWGSAVRFWYPQICTKGLSQKTKPGPRTPRPPGGPPVLGFLVRRAEGLPSTRNWPSRWPLSPTSPLHAPGDTQGNVSRQLAGAQLHPVAGSAATRGQRALLRSFISSGLVKRAVPRPSGAAPEGLAGMAELRPLFRGGGRRRKAVASSRVFFCFPNDCGVQTTECTT